MRQEWNNTETWIKLKLLLSLQYWSYTSWDVSSICSKCDELAVLSLSQSAIPLSDLGPS